ncbi:phosphoenolpyruvate synthase/pyruvate phosphate dikinase [Longilinea arvoryzae]|uniref:Phosphoenolpyruvate synthase/pyruvate phosphate dikinase n=1 Tax=Longilinea arvoryzae TaxID=360412 RepID=A0A0S7BD95_9CHLR|nr:PEP/pyruvate-binding domain-containing protein [Longilinea arvoryzae]GAP15887.1 phosphoenolpyruvate synthase/pyruvate phosphate dikinase [Longilinea arvoryzae]
MSRRVMSQESLLIIPFEKSEIHSDNEKTNPGDWLAVAGGKGSNLIRLAQAGLPVPGGFILSTQAYRAFIAANDLETRILAALPEGAEEMETLEAASASIRALFADGQIPAETANGIRAAYRSLGGPAVAVRSSATAEDLPELSFAGQQDTYLNVIGEAALLDAVVKCWASLWTARAIGYRMRNHVPQEGMALAVVVQRMVPAEVSGVLFTANPLSGLRSETVIDATFGLGEGIVSGQVEPDHFGVDTQFGRVTSRRLGRKALAVRPRDGGGVQSEANPEVTRQALPDEVILELAALGQRVAAMYGQPQDIEWAWAEGRLSLLQSRTVTSLFPIPSAVPAEPLQVFFSFAAVQGMLDPMTPCGRDAIRQLLTAGARIIDAHYTAETQTILFEAGERLWIRLTPLLRNTVGRKLVPMAMAFIEPSTRQIILQLLDEPNLRPEREGISWRARRQLARFFLPLAGNVVLNLLSPSARRKAILNRTEAVLKEIGTRMAAVQGSPRERLAQLSRLFPKMIEEFLPHNLILFISLVASGMASLNLLRVRLQDLPSQNGGWTDTLLELTRGLAYNPTTEMDLALWAAACAIRQDPAALAEFADHSAAEMAQRWMAGGSHPATQAALSSFMQRYGGRGLGEIDLGRPRWVEDPTHVFEILSGYLQIQPGEHAPDETFARGAASSQRALEQLANALGETHGGWIKAQQARFLGRRIRELMGTRESPKFFMVRLFAQFRWALLRIGEELVKAGDLAHADDLLYLDFRELHDFATEPEGQSGRDWHRRIVERREAYQRELLRRQVPRLLLSDGRAFYDGMAGNGHAGQLTGSPVSPGVVEGRVRVVFDPRKAGLLPGEILVCPGTDPSWTPLFLTAAGLIMEVGGMMTHGAVVAREYGIPAAVGVDRATSQLRTGQRVRLNGSSGVIEILGETHPAVAETPTF